jgi:hypothetical protein
MILTVTDAKGLTKQVQSQEDPAQARALYANLFGAHLQVITNEGVSWKFVKTTGDGVLIEASINEESVAAQREGMFAAWCKIMVSLQDRFDSMPCGIRVVGHWCSTGATDIIRGLSINEMTPTQAKEQQTPFVIAVKEDLFGAQMNLVFRLAQMVTSAAIVVTEELLINCLDAESKSQLSSKGMVRWREYTFGPGVPIVHLKGIESVKQNPIWLWQVRKGKTHG